MADSTENILFNLKIEENRALRSLKDVKEAVSSLDRRTRKYKNAVKEQVALETQLTNVRKRRLVVNKQLKTSIDKITKKQLQQRDATGSATSATMELSRVISDAPYGIRGMANNITQLVSQLGSASTKAGGLTGALKLMGKQLMGPLGVVFAITVVVSALDYFMGGMKKAEKGTEDLNAALKEQITVIEGHRSAIERGNLSMEEIPGVIQSLIVSNKEYAKALEKTDGSIEQQTAAIRALHLAKKEELELIEKSSRLSKIEQELNKSNVDTLKEANEEIIRLNESRSNALIGKYGKAEESINRTYDRKIESIKDIINLLNEEKQLVVDIASLGDEIQIIEEGSKAQLTEELKGYQLKQSKVKGLTQEWHDLQMQIMFVESLLKKMNVLDKKPKGKPNKISPFKTPKELEIDVKSAENAIIQYESKLRDARLKTEFNERMSAAKTEEEKKKIRENYSKDRLLNQVKSEKLMLELRKKTEEENVKLKTSNHVADLKRIYEKYMFELELNKKITDKEKDRLKKEAGGKLVGALSQAGGEQDKSLKEISDKYGVLFSLFGKLKAARLDALFSGFKKDDDDEDSPTFLGLSEKTLNDMELYIERYKVLMEGVTSFLNGEFDRQITIEENKTNSLNEELNNRLINENLSKDERASIQNKIAQNDEKLRKKKEEIEKKAFKLNKAANIAGALIETYGAASSAFRNSLANPINKLLPDAGLAKAYVSAKLAAAGGLLQVAAIARTKFQSSAAKTPINTGGGGGGSGGGNGREFNFNLAGSSQSNQIADAIQGRFNQPIEAYVVSRNITNRQQLDAEISGSASF